jgi:uncharacterized protein (DUF1810 family)
MPKSVVDKPIAKVDMTTIPDPLARFVRAQERDYVQALAELVAGQKRTHWIWYVLPQLRELGRSQMARDYGIADSNEAAAYYAHPVLGPRLVQCVNAVLGHRDTSVVRILGETDAMKFRSCLTLFANVVPDEPVFLDALNTFYEGKPDLETTRILATAAT